jgi:hypothetical protein
MSVGLSFSILYKYLIMIQRIQSLFLVLIDVILVVLLFVPYAYTHVVTATPEPDKPVTILDSTPLLVGQILLCMLAALTMAMFKNRSLQMKLCMAGVILSLLYTVFLSYNTWAGIMGVSWQLGPGTWISFGNVVLFLLARIFIKKDDELVKSVDRLR